MSAERSGAERGSALLLMPAGVLIVLILGALAVDSAVAFLGERELADLAAAAANDAATASLRPEPFYGCGRLELDGGRARSIAGTVAAARGSDAVAVSHLDVNVRNDLTPPEVEVVATGSVRLIFSPGLPGSSVRRMVQARSVAIPEPLPGTSAVETGC